MMSKTGQGSTSGWTRQAGRITPALDGVIAPALTRALKSSQKYRADRITRIPGRKSSESGAANQSGSQCRRRRGFTLIETALAIVIIGTGVLGILSAQAAIHQQNAWSTHTSTATFLANEIRELSKRLPIYDPVTGNAFWGPEANELTLADFDDLDDFDGAFGAGVIFSAADGSGPVNAMREVILGMEGWSQTVVVYNVEPSDISAPGDDALDGTTPMVRVEVTINFQGTYDPEPVPVTTVAWVTGTTQ